MAWHNRRPVHLTKVPTFINRHLLLLVGFDAYLDGDYTHTPYESAGHQKLCPNHPVAKKLKYNISLVQPQSPNEARDY